MADRSRSPRKEMASADDGSSSSSTSSKTVLVIGGFGYVAQFVIEALLAANQESRFVVHATHRPGRVPVGLPGAVRLHSMDFTDAASVDAVLTDVAPMVIVNCAAVSGLGPCEKDPEGAMKANCPRGLVDAIVAHSKGAPRLLIHFSTDIVFDGDPAKIYEEDSPAAPVNAYGRSKVAFDDFLAGRTETTCVVLRPTNIVGPVHPYVSTGTKFLQWVGGRLRTDEQSKLFEDEYRNYVWVGDLVAMTMKLIDDFPTRLPPHKLFHCGGPDSLNRMDIAKAVAEAKAYKLTFKGEDGTEVSRIVGAKRADIDLGYPSPLCVRFASPRIEPYLGRPMRAVPACIREHGASI